MNILVAMVADLLRRTAGKLQKAQLMLTVGTRLREVERWVADRGDFRLRLDYPLTAEDIVWDVGAYEGQWASDMSSKFGSEIHCFEPMPDFSATILSRFKRNPKITVHPYGLGRSDGLLLMTAAGDCSSHVKPVTQHQPAKLLEVKIRDVRQVFHELGAKNVAVLKLNIEGAEYDLLEAIIQSELIAGFNFLQIQFHDFVPDARRRRESISAALEATHRRTWCYPFVWENWVRKK